MAALDDTDVRILRALQLDGTLTVRQLAELVSLSRSACHERVSRLRDRGVIVGAHVRVDLRLLGRPVQALVAIRLRAHSRKLVGDFRDYALALPETIEIYHVGGASDYLLHVAVADSDDLRRFVLDRLTERSEVASVQTSLIFEHARKDAVEPLPA